MTDNAEKIIEQAKKIRLKSEESFAIKKQILSHMDSHPIKATGHSFFGFLNLRSVYLVPLALMLVVGGTLGILGRKDENGLPYPVILGDASVESIAGVAPADETMTTFSAVADVSMTTMSLEAPVAEVMMMKVEEKPKARALANTVATSSTKAKQENQKIETKNTEDTKTKKKGAVGKVVTAIENFFGINKKEISTSTATTTKSKKERQLEKKRKLEEKRRMERD